MAGLPEIWPGPCKSAFKPLRPHTLYANKPLRPDTLCANQALFLDFDKFQGVQK